MKNLKRNHFRLMACVGVLIGLLTVAGCTNKAQEENVSKEQGNDKPIVAVSIVPEQTFVQAVCGDLAEVVTLIPPGNSPENYEPTPQEMIKFHSADVYFTIGVPTEEANILPNAKDMNVVSLQDEVEKVYESRKFESGERDPHIWLSPKRVKVMIDVIKDKMCEIDPENKATYEANAKDYTKQLDEVDGDIKDALSTVKNKGFIVYHPAFGYLAEDYGLTMYALEEEGKESTPQHLQEMIDLAKKDNIKVIFYQEEIDSSQSKSFAEEIGGKTIMLSPLSPDYINNLKSIAKIMSEVME